MPTPKEAYANSVDRQGFGGERLRAADFGAGGEMIGKAVAGFGQDMQAVVKNIDEMQQKDAEIAAQEADNIRTAKRLKRLYEGEEGYFNKQGKNALVDRPQLEADLKAIDEEAAALLKGKPYAQRLYKQQTLRRDADDLPRIAAHESKQRNAYEDQVDTDLVDVTIDAASTAQDPLVIEQSLKTLGDVAERQARRKGLSDENGIKNARETLIGKGVASIAEKMMLRSPAEAQAFVASKAHLMDPNDVGDLLKQIAPDAAVERAGSLISKFLVVEGSTPAATGADGGAPAAGGASPASGGSAGPTIRPPEAALRAAQLTQESGGRHTDSNGRLITSRAGAQGIAQIMPGTGPNPGFGVKPLQNNSREEAIRFRDDYMAAMEKEFGGNITLALTAYNWGHANVKEHIRKVGDPNKGQISDAAFLNSIPNKEAREYAAIILNNAGSSVSGAANSSPDGPPVEVGQQINLQATVNAIRNSNELTHVEKQALIAEATRLHSHGQQVKAAAEEAARDEAQSLINRMDGGNGFTDYKQLPLALRVRLSKMPEVEGQLFRQAEANKAGRASEAATNAEFALQDLYLNNPQVFNGVDIAKQYPQLTTAQIMEWKTRQHESRQSAETPGSKGRVDHDRVRTQVKRFKGKNMKDTELGPAFDMVIRNAQQWLQNNPKETSVPDAIIEGLAQRAVMEVTVVRGGREYKLPYSQLDEDRARHRGKPPATYRLPSRDYVRTMLQTAMGRVPSDEEIDDEMARMRSSGVAR